MSGADGDENPSTATANPVGLVVSGGKQKAMRLAALGLYVFPCYAVDTWKGQNLHEAKSPMTPQGFKNASNDPLYVADHWDLLTGGVEALVGVWTGASDLIVLDIDIDSDKGTDGQFVLDEAGLDVPETIEYMTRRGGVHKVYKGEGLNLSPTKNHVTDNGEILDGIDRRSGGSYVIWWGEVPESLDDLGIAPDWFKNQSIVTGAQYEGTVEQWLGAIPAGMPDQKVQWAIDRIPAGDFGHNEMISQQTHIVKLAGEGHTGVDVALENLRDAWLRSPYDTPENERDWATALAGAVQKYGGRTEQEKDFWNARPILKHIYTQSRGTILDNPWALLGGALMRAIADAPFNVQYRSDAGPASINTFCVFVGSTSIGKSVVLDHLDAIFEWPSGCEYVPEEVGSGEAIAEQYASMETIKGDKATTDPTTGAVVPGTPDISYLHWSNNKHSESFIFDEVGRLTKMNARSGGTTILEYLKTGYSGQKLGRKLVGKGGIALPKREYRMTAIVNAQPARSDVLLNEDEVSGGLPSRFIWLPTQDPTLKNELTGKPPTKMVVKLPAWRIGRAYTAFGEIAGDIFIEALPEMNKAHEEDRLAGHTGTKPQIDGHAVLTRAKVAIGLMMLDGRTALNAEDWELAGYVMTQSETTRKYVQQVLADAQAEQVEAQGRTEGRRMTSARIAAEESYTATQRKKAVEQVEKVKADGGKPTKGVIKNKMAKSLHDGFDDLWEQLLEEGAVSK